LESIQLDQLNKEPDPFLADLETYIWNNIPTVTVASLSEFSGLSERAFYRFLQENYQIKPGTMIRDIKLKKMQQLCTEYPDISREQLANALGYSISNIIRLQGESSKLRDIEE
jgi:AraC-like DNA-binding protein